MWFEQLTGFEELSSEYVRENLDLHDEGYFISKANQRKLTYGSLEVTSLEELQKTITITDTQKIKVQEVVADVQALHKDVENEGAVFQVASQFNLLEMISPNISPEHGIDRYEKDRTQGPACAIACGAGTIYRNYFVPLVGEDGKEQVGQSSNLQVDGLELIAQAFQNEERKLWYMQNGYALPSREGLKYVNTQLLTMSQEEREVLKGKLKVGVQWGTEVTLGNASHLVSQVFCSAMPVTYTSFDAFFWEPFARLILEATYEATFYAALQNHQQGKSNKLFLTLVGGGAFGNVEQWIFDALKSALGKFENTGLDIAVVSYGRSNPALSWLKNI